MSLEQNATALLPLGIDIAKDTFDAALIKDDKKPRHKHFANTAAGHRQLLAWLQDHGTAKVHACLEGGGQFEGEAGGLSRSCSGSHPA